MTLLETNCKMALYFCDL